MSRDRWDHGSWDEISRNERTVSKNRGRGRGRGRKREDKYENPPGFRNSDSNRYRSDRYSVSYSDRYESRMYCDRYEPEDTSNSSATSISLAPEKDRSKHSKPDINVYVPRPRRSRENDGTKDIDCQAVHIYSDSSIKSSKTRKPRAPLEVYVPRAKIQQADIGMRKELKVSDKPKVKSSTWEDEEQLYDSGLISSAAQENEEIVIENEKIDEPNHCIKKDGEKICEYDIKRHNSKERKSVNTCENETDNRNHVHKKRKSREDKVNIKSDDKINCKAVNTEESKYKNNTTEIDFQDRKSEQSCISNETCENECVLEKEGNVKHEVNSEIYSNYNDYVECNTEEKHLSEKAECISDCEQDMEVDKIVELGLKKDEAIMDGNAGKKDEVIMDGNAGTKDAEENEDTFFECNSDLDKTDKYSTLSETHKHVNNETNRDCAYETLDSKSKHQSEEFHNVKEANLEQCQNDRTENNSKTVYNSELYDDKKLVLMDKEEKTKVDLNKNSSESSFGTSKAGEEMTVEKDVSSLDKQDSDGGETWDTLFDDEGEALDPKILDELTVAVGKVKVTKTQFDYYNFQPKDPDMDYDAYNHLIEIYDFPKELETRDLVMAFVEFKDKGFEIKWVDDTHAIGVFSSVVAANSALCLVHPLMKVRPLSQASRQTKIKAKKSCEFLQPYKPRPETVASVARNLVAGALGLQTNVPREKREEERRKLKEAREQKKAARKQKQAAWDGSYGGKCAMDDY